MIYRYFVVFATAVSLIGQQTRPGPAAARRAVAGTKASRATRVAPPSVAGFSGGPAIDAAIQLAIREERIPGAVVTVGHKGAIVYQKAYGNRALVPEREPMTVDTVFDIASLTKVIATTSSIMKLVEQGKLRLSEKVTTYLPEFQGGTSDITVRQLLTHYSGLRADLDLEPEWSGYETGVAKALSDHPTATPNTRFTYSDINFILLGEIVHRVSSRMLPEFANEQIFAPLGMNNTMFNPPVSVRSRIAPTEIIRGQLLRGIVHDPTTRAMGGIAGHAGLFSTASDLSLFARMMLNGGELEGTRMFSPLTIATFTSPQSPTGMKDVRGCGWDIDSRFSGNRGDLFPVGSYGHTGFTGTSIWIDPFSQSWVILLANSVHPKLKTPITSLRGRVASAAAAGLRLSPSDRYSPHTPAQAVPHRDSSAPPVADSHLSPVLSGIDVLVSENFRALRGKKVGLITNHTGLTRDGKRNIDVMKAAGVDLRALYSPEHGIAGKEDKENVGHQIDSASGLRVWSLYEGQNRRPGAEMLRDIDVLVFDIQDVGSRFYTYICTMKNALEEAARRNLEFVVLDRPNPITGTRVEGPVLDPALQSFIGCMQIPIRHGMTTGELAMMVNASLTPPAKLQIIKMRGWERGDWWDGTALRWTDPSPNMRSLNAALLYPGIGMLEGGKVYSVGRGTDAPFEQIGAEWLDGVRLAQYLNGRAVPGVRVYPTTLRPATSNFAGKTIEGIRFVITDRNSFDSVRFGIELGVALARLFPGRMDWSANDKLTGDKGFLAALSGGKSPDQIESEFAAGLEQFRNKRGKFLLY